VLPKFFPDVFVNTNINFHKRLALAFEADELMKSLLQKSSILRRI
jgi:hypothetical protein